MGEIDQAGRGRTHHAALGSQPGAWKFCERHGAERGGDRDDCGLGRPGCEAGDPAEAPEMPETVEGWKLGEPDYIIELPETQVPAEGEDLFPTFAVRLDLPEDKWVQAVEFLPGERASFTTSWRTSGWPGWGTRTPGAVWAFAVVGERRTLGDFRHLRGGRAADGVRGGTRPGSPSRSGHEF
jgi:hypothetical protein